MWNKDKSVFLSMVIVRAMYGIVALCCVAAPFLVRYYDNKIIVSNGMPSVFIPLLVTLYCAAVPAVTALVSLDRLLRNIRRGEPFTMQNVKYLRVLSYCCFAAAVIFIYFACLRPFAFLIVVAAGFFGLILRVVKNCFEQAAALREENDLTI